VNTKPSAQNRRQLAGRRGVRYLLQLFEVAICGLNQGGYVMATWVRIDCLRMISLLILALCLTLADRAEALNVTVEQHAKFIGRVHEVIERSSTWENNSTVFVSRLVFDQYQHEILSQIYFTKAGQKDPDETKTKSKSIFSYDEQGNKIRSVLYQEDGSVGHVLTFFYDNNGNRLEQVSSDANGLVVLRFVYVLDRRANTLEENHYDGGYILARHETKYDNEDRPIETIRFKGKGDIEYKATYRYGNGKLPTEILIFKGDGNLDERIAHRYDHNGMRLEE